MARDYGLLFPHMHLSAIFGKAMLSQIFNTVWLDSPQLSTYIPFLSGYKMKNTKKRPFCELSFRDDILRVVQVDFLKQMNKT